MSKFVFLQIISLYCCIFLGGAATENCKLPEGENGECIIARNCAYVIDMIQSETVLTEKTIEYLRQFYCGHAGTKPKVCCPKRKLRLHSTTELNYKDAEGADTTAKAALKTSIANVNLLPDAHTCGTQGTDRIVGGTKTGIGIFPWMALLEYDKPSGRGFHCGGNLINDRYVLTAAHCIKRIPIGWKLVSVRLGEYDLSSDIDCEINLLTGIRNCAEPVVNANIEEIVCHEQYNSEDRHQYHDIALLRLKEQIFYSKYVRPICLPISLELQHKNYDGRELIVAGWGKTEEGSKSQIKLKVEVPVSRYDECYETYSQAGVHLQEGQLCAGGIARKDSCSGDSGGALMACEDLQLQEGWMAVGIVSFGTVNCGTSGWPGIYTNVSSYIPWILDSLKP